MLSNEDIKYILELLTNGINDKDWDSVYEAIDTLKEFQDTDN